MRRRLLTLVCVTGVMMVAAPGEGADPNVGRGKATYGELCAKCHGAGGKGDGKEAATLTTKPKDFTDCARMAKSTDEQLFKIVKGGGVAADLSKDMPPYGDALEDDEIRDTIAFIRSLCPR